VFDLGGGTSEGCEGRFGALFRVLPFCYPTQHNGARRQRTGLTGGFGKVVIFQTERDASSQNRMSFSEFQDRCVKPLGHPSKPIASTS
jgi:hypothetical protein